MKLPEIIFCLIMATGGALGTFVRWGDVERFHGVGLPFAQIYWDKGMDYPNPYAILLNISAFLILALLLLGAKRLLFNNF